MKPKSNLNQTGQRSDVLTAVTTFPVTDCHYQSISLDEYRGGCLPTVEPSFRSISNGYFKTEAPQTFAGEAVLFGMIIITAALPMLSNIHAMADFIRAIGGV